MKVTYKSFKPLNPKHGPVVRYVRADPWGGYSYCAKQRDSRYDREQGTCDAAEVPKHVRDEADKYRGYVYGYVARPFE